YDPDVEDGPAQESERADPAPNADQPGPAGADQLDDDARHDRQDAEGDEHPERDVGHWVYPVLSESLPCESGSEPRPCSSSATSALVCMAASRSFSGWLPASIRAIAWSGSISPASRFISTSTSSLTRSAIASL